MEKSTKGHFEDEKPLFTLSIASELSGIPMHSIRQYIDRGLMLPFKLDSKRHLFSKGDIERIRNINVLIRDKGLNFAGIRAMMGMIPCWKIKGCGKEDRSGCNAIREIFHPCWEASSKGRLCKNEDCRECPVYRSMDNPFTLKTSVIVL